MAATLDPAPGGIAANSYASADEALAYMEGREEAASWTSSSPDDQVRALVSAARALDRESWQGCRSTTTQSLQWPRSYMPDPDAAEVATQSYVEPASIPARLKRAQCELAYGIRAGTYSADEQGLDGFETVKINKLEIKPRSGHRADTLPDRVRREIECWLAPPVRRMLERG